MHAHTHNSSLEDPQYNKRVRETNKSVTEWGKEKKASVEWPVSSNNLPSFLLEKITTLASGYVGVDDVSIQNTRLHGFPSLHR